MFNSLIFHELVHTGEVFLSTLFQQHALDVLDPQFRVARAQHVCLSTKLALDLEDFFLELFNLQVGVQKDVAFVKSFSSVGGQSRREVQPRLLR